MRAALRAGLAAGSCFFLTLGCVENPDITSLQGDTSVTLELEGLPPLPGSLNYQAWLIMGTPPEAWGHPLALFDMNEEGEMVHPVNDSVFAGTFRTDVDLAEVSGVGISIEASDVLLTYSSYTFILGGDVAGGQADLASDHWVALGDALEEAGGGFVLATPTDTDLDNELAGIWFMDPTSGSFEAGLDLPVAPTGWNYEAWVVLGGQPLSMGKFVSVSAPDSANVFGGEVTPPNFPGEDFLVDAPAGLTFPPDLAGAEVFLTLEPQGEYDVDRDAPFFLRFLEATVPAEPAASTFYGLMATGEFLPSGTVTVEEVQ